MTVDEVAAHLADPNVRVFDANGESSYKEGHVKGAAHVTFNAVTPADLPPDKDTTLIFYCKNEH
jgi:rhodanese-related sulfurtransferase